MSNSDYLQILLRRKWVVAGSLIIVVLALLGNELRKPTLYQASAQVLLNSDTAASLVGLQPGVGSADSAQRFAETQKSLARTAPVIEQTIRAAGVSETREAFLRRSSVQAVPNQDLLEFSVTDRRANAAVALANVYATQFPKYRRTLDAAWSRLARREVRAQLERARDTAGVDSPLYTSLTERLRDLDTLGALQTTRGQVVSRAYEATQTQPRPLRAAIIALALGLLVGVALALLVDSLDTSVRTPNEIAAALGLPLLARIPRSGRGGSDVVTVEDPASAAAEAYRILWTELERSNHAQPAKVVMVTSAVENEGKSGVTANLATAFAQGGRRVIVVDLDIRRPSLATLFTGAKAGFDDRPGIADLVLKKASIADALRPIAITSAGTLDGAISGDLGGSLHLIGVGSAVVPSRYVVNHRLTEIVDVLREHCDLLLFDSAPLLLGSDSLALADYMDALLIVSRLGASKIAVVTELRRVLESLSTPAIGVVVTDVPTGVHYPYAYSTNGDQRSARLNSHEHPVKHNVASRSWVRDHPADSLSLPPSTQARHEAPSREDERRASG